MKTILGPALLALLMSIPAGLADDTAKVDLKIKEDLERLQGAWQMTKGVRGGQEAPKEVVEESRLIFKDDTFSFENSREKTSAKIKLDASKSPKQLDADVTDGNNKGEKRLAIYEVEGDNLKLCWTRRGDRPAKFESKDGQDALYMELKRAKK